MMVSMKKKAELLESASAIYKTGCYKEAEDVLAEAVRMDPACADTHFLLGQTLKTGFLYVSRIMRAKAAFAVAVKVREEWPQAWCELALTSLWVADLDGALEAPPRALPLDPTLSQDSFILYFD